MQPPQNYSVRGQGSSGQLTGKTIGVAGARLVITDSVNCFVDGHTESTVYEKTVSELPTFATKKAPRHTLYNNMNTYYVFNTGDYRFSKLLRGRPYREYCLRENG
ncbi:UNVERIFIED_CONTAM: hypothetical protein FKN15_065494 [Acipenser sinensis]